MTGMWELTFRQFRIWAFMNRELADIGFRTCCLEELFNGRDFFVGFRGAQPKEDDAQMRCRAEIFLNGEILVVGDQKIVSALNGMNQLPVFDAQERGILGVVGFVATGFKTLSEGIWNIFIKQDSHE